MYILKRSDISVHAGCIETFPSIYVKGEIVYSDKTWTAEDDANAPVKAGCSRYFTDEKQEPSVWNYSERVYLPIGMEARKDGVLYEFGTERTVDEKSERI